MKVDVPVSDIKVMNVREFRTAWTSLGPEIVRVEARGRLVGHWVPAANPLRWGDPKERDGR